MKEFSFQYINGPTLFHWHWERPSVRSCVREKSKTSGKGSVLKHAYTDCTIIIDPVKSCYCGIFVFLFLATVMHKN